ncbi:NusA antitermination factor [Thermosporothrix hazakensis]|jgi:N utilization substance protein A|uniref:Transcription termination/antitermination protein NusA n=2 Tax=Thermosporothrix TaxID=768650 RepID=A0A326UEW5_THEHA|nr:transcription termination factor NusA [Thermosporothrix hazakensis]PZW36411.1 NusA antitermination factor [Thermosporothrix hazakensis]BBH88878.1 transcription termination/antitermination protein NusA [Thermosporothrix sp. COM3]GCE47063.1 transcription termination/antitermination protein NusA [Thermosporothrix hazakensis]
MRSEFQAAIAQLIAEKGLPREVVMETVANALLAAYRKSFGGGENVRIEVDKNGEVHVWASKRVVAQVTDPNEEISLAEAQRLIPNAALGQLVDVDSSFIFARIPTQTAKQVILQRIREAEHEHLYDQIKNWVGEIRLGTLTRKDANRGWVIDFDLDKVDKVEGLMPVSEEVPTERYRPGQRIRVYIYDVRKVQGRLLQILASRTHRDLVRRLFEAEVPEIYEGTVEIMAIAREQGSRTKVAVHSRQEGLDPIGACVGVRGSRINNIVRELNDEKIDIILWDKDPATFVANSLSPVKPLKVELRESDHTAIVTVPERQLSLAIGKDGQNARLAAKLTGWRVDVVKPAEGEVYEEPVEDEAVTTRRQRSRSRSQK